MQDNHKYRNINQKIFIKGAKVDKPLLKYIYKMLETLNF